ncbi:MAG: P-loop NTPase [Thermodesulfobacteriota bacterium]
MKIAISGKGGVGKTTILALLAVGLRRHGREVLVIDADPSPHMAATLGFADVSAITPVAEMKELLKERSGKEEGSPFYQLNPRVDDLLARFMVHKEGIHLMVVGAIATGGGGCACAENTVLRRLTTRLLLSPSQVVLLDMEAGVEHLGRGTVAGVDHLLVVVIPTQSSVRTGLRIQELARQVGIPRISFVGNQVAGPEDEAFLATALGAPPAAAFPDAAAIRQAERRRTPIDTVAADHAAATDALIAHLLA